MLNDRLSEEEKFLLGVLGQTGCASWWTASYMLWKKYGVKYKQTTAIISHLNALHYIHKSHDSQEWVAFGRDNMKTGSPLSADMIRSTWSSSKAY